ncbi:MAG: hypothetical protein ABI663_09275 [Chryseolinea sp.]
MKTINKGIEMTATDVKVCMNDDQTPSLVVKKIGTITKGKLSVWLGDGSGDEFSILSITNN